MLARVQLKVIEGLLFYTECWFSWFLTNSGTVNQYFHTRCILQGDMHHVHAHGAPTHTHADSVQLNHSPLTVFQWNKPVNADGSFSVVNNRVGTLASYRQKQLRMYLETHFPIHWTLSYCLTIDRLEKKQTSRCYSKSNWELTNCFFSASLCTTVSLFLHCLYNHILTDGYSMWGCSRVGLAWWCSRWGTFDLCQSKQQTKSRARWKAWKGAFIWHR